MIAYFPGLIKRAYDMVVDKYDRHIVDRLTQGHDEGKLLDSGVRVVPMRRGNLSMKRAQSFQEELLKILKDVGGGTNVPAGSAHVHLPIIVDGKLKGYITTMQPARDVSSHRLHTFLGPDMDTLSGSADLERTQAWNMVRGKSQNKMRRRIQELTHETWRDVPEVPLHPKFLDWAKKHPDEAGRYLRNIRKWAPHLLRRR
jgi:hypothetical protein